ncbi:MAG TPA: DUF3307 domain-containing protein [Candidatus Limnocylindrales bacterium]|nr:DUF3307 domain-containing protein [Candidatus Limnocylindrales bacterium]
MTSETTLVLAWLVLAHLVADFLLQTDGMVSDKFSPGRRGWRGLLLHAGAVAVCLLPVVAVYGGPGLAFLAVSTVGHVLIDRWKVRATRHAEAEALAEAHRRHQPTGTVEGLGPAWTPKPGALFVADQVAHMLLLAVAWLVLLARQEPVGWFTDAADQVVRMVDAGALHSATLIGVVLLSLVIVNVRAAALFVATLVHPRESVSGADLPGEPAPPPAAPPRRWRLQVGPVVATAEPLPAGPAPAGAATRAGTSNAAAPRPEGHASPARIGATIGVLERLLIVAFVLTGSTAAIGFVVAAKTLARFRQLDDRDFAEYYLLGTLASVAVALGSGLVAAAVLSTLNLG